jgi:hypothetical protein
VKVSHPNLTAAAGNWNIGTLFSIIIVIIIIDRSMAVSRGRLFSRNKQQPYLPEQQEQEQH